MKCYKYYRFKSNIITQEVFYYRYNEDVVGIWDPSNRTWHDVPGYNLFYFSDRKILEEISEEEMFIELL